jgi:hypothetical protein
VQAGRLAGQQASRHESRTARRHESLPDCRTAGMSAGKTAGCTASQQYSLLAFQQAIETACQIRSMTSGLNASLPSRLHDGGLAGRHERLPTCHTDRKKARLLAMMLARKPEGM